MSRGTATSAGRRSSGARWKRFQADASKSAHASGFDVARRLGSRAARVRLAAVPPTRLASALIVLAAVSGAAPESPPAAAAVPEAEKELDLSIDHLPVHDSLPALATRADLAPS